MHNAQLLTSALQYEVILVLNACIQPKTVSKEFTYPIQAQRRSGRVWTVFLQNQTSEVLKELLLVCVGGGCVYYASGAVWIRPGGANPTWILPVAAH